MTTTDAHLDGASARRCPGRLLAAVAGAVAAVAALGTGELVAGLTRRFLSPVEAVAGVVIDTVPGPVERWAIRVLGTNDKPALVWGTVLLSVALGALLGLAGRRRPWVAAAGITGFGVLGVLATLQQASAAASVPSGAAALAGVGVVVALMRTGSAPADPGDAPASSGRRAFVVLTGAVLAGAAAAAAGGRALASRFDVTATREAVRLPSPVGGPVAIGDGVSVGVEGVAPFITPRDEFYRVDTALSLPQVDVATWRLRLHGMVERELELAYDDLLAMDLVERAVTLTCVSNTVGGDLVGTARWLGVPLAGLLDRVGVDPAATQLVGRSVDGYTCGFPVADVEPLGSLVVVGMNGEPLPVERGFPARLVTPGLYGYVSATKWLSDIELTTFEAFDQYWVPRGWDERAPIKTQARIDTPGAIDELSPGRVPVAGVAWAQPRGVTRVEVRVDDGDWVDAELAEALNDVTWRQWRYDWEATEGTHRITVRATDGSGEVQTEQRAEPFPNGASGWMTLVLRVG